MGKKKFLAKLVVMSALVGGINFLPLPNIEVGNIEISVAYAENKNFVAKDGAMTDVEIIETQAKEASRMRAIEAVKEKIAAYVRNFSGAKGKLNEDDIAAIAEKYEEVGTAQYKKLFYNAVDEDGKELGKVGIMYEATVTAKFNSKKITEYIKLNAQEKEKRIRQARESRAKFEELDREYEELRKNARTKTPEQLQSEIKDFDDKLSDLEKSREKNKSAKKDKPTTQKNKILENVPMQFSQITKIGSIFHTPSSGVVIRKSDYVSSPPIGTFQGEKTYGNFTARWGDENNGIYCQWDKYPPTFGGKNGGIAVQTAVDVSIEKIKNSKNMPLYMIIVGNSDIRGTNFYLIGERPDGKWVKYFETNTIKQSYPLPQNSYLSIKYSVRGDTVVIPYEQFQNRNRVAIGEFRFKWDEAAKWFGVEKITYDQKQIEQKPAPENKAVTNQPMQFSQLVEIGRVVYSPGYGLDAVWFENYSWHKENKTYNTGIVRFGEGKGALYVYYYSRGFHLYLGAENTNVINSYLNNQKSYILEDNLKVCELNKTIIEVNEAVGGTIHIYKINNTLGKDIYFLYHDNSPTGRYYVAVGPVGNGKWAKYFNLNTFMHYPKTDNVDIPFSYYCKGDTIIVEFKNNLSGKKVYEMRYKWNEKKQWFGVEKFVY